MTDQPKLVIVPTGPAPKEHTLAHYVAETRGLRGGPMPRFHTNVGALAWASAERDIIEAFRYQTAPPWDNYWLARALTAIDSVWSKPDGMIYLISTVDRRACKVGYSVDPVSRRQQLQTGSPDELTIEQTHPGTQAVERALQAILPGRMTGEWFALAEPVWSAFFALDAIGRAWRTESERTR